MLHHCHNWGSDLLCGRTPKLCGKMCCLVKMCCLSGHQLCAQASRYTAAATRCCVQHLIHPISVASLAQLRRWAPCPLLLEIFQLVGWLCLIMPVQGCSCCFGKTSSQYWVTYTHTQAHNDTDRHESSLKWG